MNAHEYQNTHIRLCKITFVIILSWEKNQTSIYARKDNKLGYIPTAKPHFNSNNEQAKIA